MKTGFDRARLVLLVMALAMSAMSGSSAAQKPPPFGVAAPPPGKPSQPIALPPGKSTARPLGPGGALYIAGDGFSLEQAIDDGLREGGGAPFPVLVLGAEISKLGVHGATADLTAVIRKAINGGGTLYVCERDVKRQGFAANEFLPGVRVVRGFSKAEALTPENKPNPSSGAPLAPVFRMREICAD